jgi:hypothetical protein
MSFLSLSKNASVFIWAVLLVPLFFISETQFWKRDKLCIQNCTFN